MILEIDLNQIANSKLSGNQFIICYLLFLKHFDYLNMYLTANNFIFFKEDIEYLMNNEYVTRYQYDEPLNIRGFSVTAKFINLVSNGKEDYFDEFLAEYPVSVLRGGGIVDYVRTGISKARIKYNMITRKNRSKHEHIVKCLQYELRKRESENSLGFLKKLPKWLEDEEWKAYELCLNDNQLIKKELGYGNQLE